MSEWKKVKFLNLFSEPTKNGIYKSKEFHGRGAKIINMGEVFAYSFIGNQEMSRVEINDKERNSFIVKNGDLLFARRSLVESGAGKCAIANGITEETTFESSIIRVRLNENYAIPLFYMYWMRSLSGRTAINGIVNGVNVKGIRATDLQNIEVDLPPLHTQHRIATILSRYDSLIENYQKQIKLLEEAAQRLYKEWFVDLHFPGHENTKIVDGVPEGWEKKKLVEFAEIVMGQSPKSEYYNNEFKGLPFHQGVGSYGNRYVVDNTYSTSFTRIAEPNSVLFSVRAPVGRLNITKNKVVIGRGLAAMTHKKGYQSYLFYLLKERFFKDNIIGNGAIFASISKNELHNLDFTTPTDDLVIRFNTIAGNLDDEIMKVDSQIRLLTEARDRLLPKLINGVIIKNINKKIICVTL